MIEALKHEIEVAIHGIEVRTIKNVLKNWDDRMGYCKASHGSFVTTAALDSFQRGLRPELEFSVALRNPATIDAAIKIAHAEAHTLIDRSQLLPSASQYPSSPRPFSNLPSRSYASPIVPRVPHAKNPRSYAGNGERFTPRAPEIQHNGAQQPEHSRPFMTA